MKSEIKPRSLKINTPWTSLIPLTEAIILTELPTKYKWIARNANGDLMIYTHKPVKKKYDWVIANNKAFSAMFFPYRNKFNSIKWSDNEPVNIDRLLYENMLSLEAARRAKGGYC